MTRGLRPREAPSRRDLSAGATSRRRYCDRPRERRAENLQFDLTSRGHLLSFARPPMKRVLVPGLVLATLAAGSAAFTQSFWVSLGQNKGPTQPIKFEHVLHAGKLGDGLPLLPLRRREVADREHPAGQRVHGLPQDRQHRPARDQKLTAYFDRGEPMPWVEVYKLPEHVKFNHKRHVEAGDRRASIATARCRRCRSSTSTRRSRWAGASAATARTSNNPDLPASMDCLVCHH